MALENSRASLLAALEYRIDAIEFDVRRTRDNRLVVMHDAHTGRIASQKVRVGQKTLAELQAVELRNGQHIMSFDEVFALLSGKIPLVIDVKDAGSAEAIMKVIATNPKATINFTSLRYNELARLHRLRPDIPFYIIDSFNPIEAVYTAGHMKAAGISLNKWLMNPLTYWLARHRHLEVRVYTVNNRWLGRMLRRLYPDIVMYTDYPQHFVGR